MTTFEGLVAVYTSPQAALIHLHLPGFGTQKARSSHYPTAVCGVTASLQWGSDRTGWKPTGRVWVPFAQAVELERHGVPREDPRPSAGTRRWCGKCLGMLLVHGKLADAPIDAILARMETTP